MFGHKNPLMNSIKMNEYSNVIRFIRALTYTHIYTHAYTHINTQIHTHTQTHIKTHTHMHMCACAYAHTLKNRVPHC